MKFIGNLLWFFIVGLWSGLIWLLIGILWCVSIVGIPVGFQCFKFGGLSFFPFGKDIVFSDSVGNLLLNIIWLIFGGIELAITYCVFGAILCITIVGIPFGLQCFKFARLSILPFGAEILRC
jgi:uncharacterized membrane protein YccF (DUF307 family)